MDGPNQDRTMTDKEWAQQVLLPRIAALEAERDELRARLEAVIKITDEYWQTLCHYDHDDISTNWSLMRPSLSTVCRENADIPGKVLAVVDGYSANTGQNRSWVDEFTIGEIGDGDYPDIPVTVTVTERKEK